MRMLHKKIVLLAVVCAIALSGAAAKGLHIGDYAPDFEMELSDGGKVKLSSFRGKVVLLHFWATWCPPCQKELPEMDALAKQIAQKGSSSKLDFLAVCVSDTQKSLEKYLKKNGFTFRGGLDEDGNIAEVYGVEGIPASILISPDGKIEKMTVGMMSRADLDSFVAGYAD